MRRTHESWVSATLEEQGLQSGEAASPLSSVVSLKKKMVSVCIIIWFLVYFISTFFYFFGTVLLSSICIVVDDAEMDWTEDWASEGVEIVFVDSGRHRD